MHSNWYGSLCTWIYLRQRINVKTVLFFYLYICFCKTTTGILKGFNKSKILKMSLEVQISSLRLFWVFPLLTTEKICSLGKLPWVEILFMASHFFFFLSQYQTTCLEINWKIIITKNKNFSPLRVPFLFPYRCWMEWGSRCHKSTK